ncbi:MAG: SDR family NAD(P)-dependent oxidoreductase [Eubacteriales bacterium]|nr:SDR family NAD(P)-dependent oxidoreductase [Eubacteriales bacterium]
MEHQRTAFITGATSGIGLAAAIEFAKKDFKVFAVGRNAQRCERAHQSILEHAPLSNVEFLLCDLSRKAEMTSLCGTILQKTRILDVVIHAAGLITNQYATTDDGIEVQFAVNHLAPFLLTQGLISALALSTDARVILITSLARHYAHLNLKDLQMSQRYSGLTQYGRTKLCNVLYATEFNHRYQNTNIRAFAMDSGIVKTDIGIQQMSGILKTACRFVINRGSDVGKTAEQIHDLVNSKQVLKTYATYYNGCKPKRPHPSPTHRSTASALWEASEVLIFNANRASQ